VVELRRFLLGVKVTVDWQLTQSTR